MHEKQSDPVTTIISAMEGITKVLWSAAALLAPWLVPLAPAAFFGWALYQTAVEAHMPEYLAMGVGLVAALGLESVNIAAAHAAVQLSHDREDHAKKFALAVGLVAFYVAVGMTSMLLLNTDDNMKIVGAAMFLLAPVAITAQALTLDLVWVRNDVERTEVREDERQARLDEQDFEIKKLRIQQNAIVRIERERARTLTGQVTGQAPRWPDKQAYLSDPDRPSGLTSGQLAAMADISDRTARRWMADDRNGKETL